MAKIKHCGDILKQQGKCKMKQHTLYIPKGNIKKSNEIKKKMLTR